MTRLRPSASGLDRASDTPRSRHDAADPFDELSDDALADAVLADAHERMKSCRPVTLDWYLTRIPSLSSRPVVLDAAIEAALRAGCRESSDIQGCLEQLIHEHPELRVEIETAGALTSLLWRSEGVRGALLDGREPVLPPRIGPLLDDGRSRYEPCERIGQGASGQVFAAVDHHFADAHHRPRVAVKIIDSGTSADSCRAREEARVLSSIRHPNVVQVFDYGQDASGIEYIVMELAPGVSLADATAREMLDGDHTALISTFMQIARGLQAAHSEGLLHCDLKPSNVLVIRDEDNGQVQLKLTDFGLAKRVSHAPRIDDPAEIGVQASLRGNLAFMAPEQRARSAPHSQRSDIFALAGMLFWLLTDSLPCHPKRQAEGVQAPLPWPVGFRIDPSLRQIIDRAAAFDPADRHDTAASFADDLRHWVERRPVEWQCPGPAKRLRLWVSRSPFRAIATAAALAGLAGAAYVLQLHADQAAYRRGKADVLHQISGIRAEFKDIRTVNNLRDWLMVSKALEMLPGEGALSGGPGEAPASRLLAVRQYLERLEGSAASESLESMVWRLDLAFQQLIDTQYHDTTGALLAEVRSYFSDRLEPQDPIHGLVESLQSAAVIKQAVLANNGSAELPPVPLLDLGVAYRSVLTALGERGIGPGLDTDAESGDEWGRDLTRSEMRDPVLRLLLRSVWHASCDELLGDAPVHAWAQTQVRALQLEDVDGRPDANPESRRN